MEKITMRSSVAATVSFGLLATSAHADTMKNCGAAWSVMYATNKAKTTDAADSKTCLAKGYTVPPASSLKAGPAPAGATGQCKDGTYTMTKTHSGACSSYGGVGKWY